MAFDARGHGMTMGDLDEGCEYTWKDVADDIHEALVSAQTTPKVGIDKVAIDEYR